MKNDWLTIPGFPNYEINGDFEVRNRKTKRLLTVYRGFVFLYSDDVQYKRSAENLRRRAESGKFFTLTLSKGTEIHSFATKRAAIEFLAEKTFYSTSSVKNRWKKNSTEIFGWHVEYVV